MFYLQVVTSHHGPQGQCRDPLNFGLKAPGQDTFLAWQKCFDSRFLWVFVDHGTRITVCPLLSLSASAFIRFFVGIRVYSVNVGYVLV